MFPRVDPTMLRFMYAPFLHTFVASLGLFGRCMLIRRPLRRTSIGTIHMSSRNPKSASRSPTKKRRVEHESSAQGSLELFFKRSPRKTTASGLRIGEGIQLASSSKVQTEVTESDEKMAMRIAAEEGLDIETARKMETGWKSTSSGPISAQEPIDVDALSDSDHHDETPRSVGEILKAPLVDKDAGQDKTPPRDVPMAKAIKSISGSTHLGDYSDIASYPDFAADPLVFPTSNCPWGTKLPAPYSFLSYTLCSLSSTRSRIAITNILTNTLRLIIRHDPPSLLPALYLLSNSLSPPYIPIELGLGPSIISKAIQHVSGLTPAALKRLYTRTGDAGDVAFEARSNLRTLIPHPALTISGVYDSFINICLCKGEGATKQRQAIVEKLLVAARGEETRYLVRTMAQHIRVGAVRTSILTALGRALVLTRAPSQSELTDESPYFAPAELLSNLKKSSGKGKKKDDGDPVKATIISKYANSEGLIKRIYVQHPNYDHIVEAILRVGPEGLSEALSISVGESSILNHPRLSVTSNSIQAYHFTQHWDPLHGLWTKYIIALGICRLRQSSSMMASERRSMQLSKAAWPLLRYSRAILRT